jgi:aminoglycoside 3-N-acetyltransferase
MNSKHVSGSTLVRDLSALSRGELRGSCVMVHTRMSDLGCVVGGAPTVIDSLREVIGSEGTLLVLTGWEDRPPYHQHDWDPEVRHLYREHAPPFDPLRCLAERDHGRIPEAVRTWPGAAHSAHPVCGFAALGQEAQWLVGDQSLDEGYGEGSPLHRLVDADGRVLLIGDLFENVTLLHYAEYVARVAEKRFVEYEMPVLVDGQRTWRRIRELDSSLGAFPYDELALEVDAFEAITRSALDMGIGRSGSVGHARAHLLPARGLLDHGRRWMEERFA